MGNHETADVLRKVPREPHQIVDQSDEAADDGAVRIEPGFFYPLSSDPPAIPPLDRFRQRTHLQFLQAQRLAHVANGTARSVTDDGGGQRRTFARVFPVDVLNDLLAAFVLEIHIDIGRFIAFLGNKPLHQHDHASRIHFGDAQAVTNRRIGRGAAPLAEDALGTSEPDDVVHGQEIGLVIQIRDELELVLDELDDMGRHALRPAPPHALFGEIAQVARGRFSGRDQLVWILIAQFVQGEIHTFGYRQGFSQQIPGIEAGQFIDGPQKTLTIGIESKPGLLQWRLQPDSRDGILQCPPRPAMHVHIPAGDDGDIELPCTHPPSVQQLCVTTRDQQLRRQPQTAREPLLEPGARSQIRRLPG